MAAVLTSPLPGIVEPENLYSVDVACRLMNWGKAAWREARRRGLQCRYVGKNCYVTGAALIAYVEQHGDTER